MMVSDLMEIFKVKYNMLQLYDQTDIMKYTRLSHLIADLKLRKRNADYVQVLHTNTIVQGYGVIEIDSF